jgi:hypothetical protein
MDTILYTQHRISGVRSSLNPGGRDGPFVLVYLTDDVQLTTHDPADFDAVAAEFTEAAAMLREALAEAGKEARDE